MTDDTEVADPGWAAEELAGTGDRLVGSDLDGRFRIVAPLDSGGMGQVYRGKQLSVDRDVAVKILHGSLAAREEFRHRFLREARVISGFTHPNIVQPIDFGRDEQWDVLYFVMEYVEGLGLHEMLSGQRFTPELALEIAYQVAGALAEAHDQEIVHRDLKSENLVLTSVADGRLQVKVLDFGIARPREDDVGLTATGQVYGTPSYMAPEQASDGQVDGRTDLYALGIVLFEMLTARLPIDGDSSMEVMVAQIEEGPPPLAAVLPREAAPAGVFELVDDLLENERTDRPPDARTVRTRIQSIRDEQGWSPFEMDPDAPLVTNLDPYRRPAVDWGGEDEAETGESSRPSSSGQTAVPSSREEAADDVESSRETTPAGDDYEKKLETADAPAYDSTEESETPPGEQKETKNADTSEASGESESSETDAGEPTVVDSDAPGPTGPPERPDVTQPVEGGGGWARALPFVDAASGSRQTTMLTAFIFAFVSVWLVLFGITVAMLLVAPDILVDWLAVTGG